MRTIKQTTRPVKSKVSASTPATLTPAIITDVANPSANVARLTFNTNVFRNKTPGYTAGAETVVSAAEVSATEVDVTFTGAVGGATLVVPANDPGIRTQTGGFVPAGSYAIPSTP